jgi:formate/nitrite transporter FocA (FNT family)
MLTLSQHTLVPDAWTTFWMGMPAGFLVAAIAWILPNARSGDLWVIVSITYAILIGGFSHVVTGSVEAWLCWLAAKANFGHARFGFILPVPLSNIAGRTGLFAVLAHGQVRCEITSNGSVD